MTEKDVQCTNCALDLRPENALMHDGKPFCDEFCRDHYAEETEIIFDKRTPKTPVIVKLYRCKNCCRIYGQEIDAHGNHIHLSPTCDCDFPLGMERVNAEDW